MATWPGAGKGVPLQRVRGDLGRQWQSAGGPCFAGVLKLSKWSMAEWPGAGKAVAKR